MARKPRKQAPTTELVSAEIDAFLKALRARPRSSWGVVVGDDGTGHLYGGHGRAFEQGTMTDDRASLNYTKQDVDAFQRLAARAYGWPGHRLHLNELKPYTDPQGRKKQRWQTCWCRTCAPIRRSLSRFVTFDDAEDMLALALASEKPWFLPAPPKERQRVYGARNNERGKCQRCPNPVAIGRNGQPISVCESCNEAAKARVYAARNAAKLLRQKAS